MKSEPDPEYLEHLEWQLRTEVRRRERFPQPAASTTMGRRSALGLAAASFLLGTVGTLAAQRIPGPVRVGEEPTVTAAGGEAVDSVTPDPLLMPAPARSALAELEEEQHERALLRIDERETTASGRPPRDDLSAPVVGERDFVHERLELVRARAMTGVVDAVELASRFRELDTEEADTARWKVELKVANTRALVDKLDKRLDLRRSFLQGGTPIEHIDMTVERIETEYRLAVLEGQMDASNRRREVAIKRIQQDVLRLVELGELSKDVAEKDLERRVVLSPEFKEVDQAGRALHQQREKLRRVLYDLRERLGDPLTLEEERHWQR
jgi:hypothetical protein